MITASPRGGGGWACMVVASAAAAAAFSCTCSTPPPPAAAAPLVEEKPAPVPAQEEAAQDAAAAAPQEAAPAPQAGGSGSSAEKTTVVIAAAGDIILHERVKNAAANQAGSPSEEGDDKFQGWWHLFRRIEPVLAKADIALANLETPIAKERKKATGRPPVLNGPPAALDALAAAGFDVMNIATNHAYDQMRDGVGETAGAVRAAGMEAIGGGATKKEAEAAIVTTVGALKVAFLGWTMVMNKNFNEVKTPDKPWVNTYKGGDAAKRIAEAREEADLVVVSMHWGGEFDMKADAIQKGAARELCDAGADIVFGHGPHILERVEMLEPKGGGGGRCLVAYSLGNFVSNQGLKYRYGWHPPNMVEAKNIPYTRDGIVLRVTVTKGEGGRASIGKVEAVPIWTENNWLERYSKPVTPPDDIFVMPLLPAMKGLEEKSLARLLYEERLAAIKELVGGLVDYVEL